MSFAEQIRSKRREVLQELASLEKIRRGSVVEQFVESVRKDGTRVRRGPYRLYSFKEKRKTISRRLKNEQEATQYRSEIQAFRRFQELVAELICLGEQLSDLPDTGEGDQKKTRKCRFKNKPK